MFMCAPLLSELAVVASFVSVVPLATIAAAGPRGGGPGTTVKTICLTLLWGLVIVVGTSSALETNPRPPVMDALQERLLADLGMHHLPDIKQARVSPAQIEHMLALYDKLEAEDDNNNDDDNEGDNDDNVEMTTTTLSPSHRTTMQRLYLFNATVRLVRSKRGHRGANYVANFHGESSFQEKLHPEERLLSATLRFRVVAKHVPSQVIIQHRRSAITTVDLHSQDSYYQVDLTPTVANWFRKPQLAKRLHLRGTALQLVDEVFIELRVSRPSLELNEGHHERYKRSMDTLRSQAKQICNPSSGVKTCCMYSMNVSFADIGWKWVLRPKQFSANFCKGRCPSRIKSYASTHALLQSLMSRMHGRDQVPAPCCAPKKLRKLRILHLNDANPPQLVITKKKGMIVQECACS